ncbi:MAG: Zn-ribbon domain-containing OB-fold protein [Acidimicrobiia bacterium]
MSTGFLLPDLNDEDGAPFWAAAADHRLVVQRCARCALRTMPPRPMCPTCRGTEFAWETLSGRGTIWSYVVAHPPLLPAYAEFAPYPVVTVSIDEDPLIRFVGNLVRSSNAPINSVDPATIAIGAPVQVVFTPVDDVVFPRWMPV